MAYVFPFATVDELKDRWQGFPVGGERQAGVLLEDASQFILDVCPAAVDASDSTRRRVVCAVVKRAMQSEASGLEGFSSASETAGPFSVAHTVANPSGDFYLTKQEMSALGGGKRARVNSVKIESGFSALRHQPWCDIAFAGNSCSCGAALSGGEPLWEY